MTTPLCTLGTSAPVITETLDGFYAPGIQINRRIPELDEFREIEHQTHADSWCRYKDEEYYVRLPHGRVKLVENSRLHDVWCQIQVKTFYDHASSQVDHRFRYKSDENRALTASDQKVVAKAFLGANVSIEDALEKLSQLSPIYKTCSNTPSRTET